MKMLLRRVAHLIDFISRKLGFLAGILFFVTMLLITREVVARYIFNSPSILTIDLASQLMMAGIFLGAAYVLQIKGYVVIDIIYSRLPLKARNIIYLIGLIACFIFVSVIAWQAFELALKTYQTGERATTPTMWPVYPTYVVIFIGTLLFILQAIVNFVRGCGALSIKRNDGD